MKYNRYFTEDKSKEVDLNNNNRCPICAIVTCDHKHDVKAMIEYIEKLEIDRDHARRQECISHALCTCYHETIDGRETLKAANKIAKRLGWHGLFEEEGGWCEQD